LRRLAFAAMSVALIQAPSASQVAVQPAVDAVPVQPAPVPDASPRCEATPGSSLRIRHVSDLGHVWRDPNYLPAVARMIVVTSDHAAMLIDTVQGSRVAELSLPGPGAPEVVAVSPDQQIFVWNDGENLIGLRRSSTGEPIAQPDLLQQARGMEFSNDSSRLALRLDAGVALLDTKTGMQVGLTETIAAETLHFSRNGARLIVTSNGGRGAVIDTRTGARAYSIALSDGEKVEFDQEGTHALVTGAAGWRLIDPASARELAKGPADDSVAFVGEDAYVLAQGGADVRLIDAKTGRVAIRPGKLATTTSRFVRDFGLQVSPDRQTAITRSPDGSARLWDLARGRGLAELGVFAVGGPALVNVDSRIGDLAGKAGVTDEFRFTPDGDRLIAHDIAGRLSIWDTRSGRRVSTIGQFTKEDWLWLAEDNSFALAILTDKSATLWNTRSGWRIASIGQFPPDLLDTDFLVSSDQRFLLIGDKQKTELWNVDTGVRIASRETAANVEDAVFSSTGAWLALRPRADESRFEILNSRTGARIAEASPADGASFNRIGNEDALLTRSSAAFTLWDMNRGERAVTCQFSDPSLSMMDVLNGGDALSLIVNVGGGQSQLWRVEPN
jgi:WD40 repeat protein